jgi:hypothetical protein
MSEPTMAPELEQRLRVRLQARAERLATIAAMPHAPTVVVALMAEHVVTTAILLCGDKFANAVFTKLIINLREANGICMCGNGLKAEGEPLCQPCIDEVDKHDREADEHLALHAPAKGRVS